MNGSDISKISPGAYTCNCYGVPPTFGTCRDYHLPGCPLLLVGEITTLRAANAELVRVEHELSDAYVRLRQRIPGALDTHPAPTAQAVWKHTEKCLATLRARAASLERAVEAAEQAMKYAIACADPDDRQATIQARERLIRDLPALRHALAEFRSDQ